MLHALKIFDSKTSLHSRGFRIVHLLCCAVKLSTDWMCLVLVKSQKPASKLSCLLLFSFGADNHLTQNTIYIFIQRNAPLNTEQIPSVMPTLSWLVIEIITQGQVSGERTYAQRQRSTFMKNTFMKSCTSLYCSDKDVKQLHIC